MRQVDEEVRVFEQIMREIKCYSTWVGRRRKGERERERERERRIKGTERTYRQVDR